MIKISAFRVFLLVIVSHIRKMVLPQPHTHTHINAEPLTWHRGDCGNHISHTRTAPACMLSHTRHNDIPGRPSGDAARSLKQKRNEKKLHKNNSKLLRLHIIRFRSSEIHIWFDRRKKERTINAISYRTAHTRSLAHAYDLGCRHLAGAKIENDGFRFDSMKIKFWSKYQFLLWRDLLLLESPPFIVIWWDVVLRGVLGRSCVCWISHICKMNFKSEISKGINLRIWSVSRLMGTEECGRSAANKCVQDFLLFHSQW